jgi:hypothetical protein
VQKSGHELVLDPPDESSIFPIGGYTIGYVRDYLTATVSTSALARNLPSTIDRMTSIAITATISVTRSNFFCASARLYMAMVRTRIFI